MMLNNALRGTGRTTRMLEKAIALAKEGRAVYIIAHDVRYAAYLQSKVPPWIKVETETSLGDVFSWRDLKIRRAHPNCVVLIDHFAIESRFGRVLEELHAYDDDQQEYRTPVNSGAIVFRGKSVSRD